MGQPVFLVGEASSVGALQGQLQAPVLQNRAWRVMERSASAGLDAVLRERADRFGAMIDQCAPAWLAEAGSQAAAGGIELWQLLAFNCLPANFWGTHYAPAPLDDARIYEELVNAYEAQGVDLTLGGDCTSFFALAEATLPGETLLHKNRDERDEVQCIYTKQLDGCNRFVGAGDVGNLGTAHLHTEDFWVGANNTGSEVVPGEYIDCALSDSHVLRYLAERCAGLDEIVPAITDLIERGLVGGGAPGHGSIWLFADAIRGLVVEATSRRLAYEWYEGDAMVVRTNHFLFPCMQEYAAPAGAGSMHRQRRAMELWEALHGFASIPACAELGRDREGAPLAICRNPSDGLGSVTVSASTATISPHDDNRCQTHFRDCHPAYTPGVIMTPLDRVSDSDLVSGSHNQHWRNYRGFV